MPPCLAAAALESGLDIISTNSDQLVALTLLSDSRHQLVSTLYAWAQCSWGSTNLTVALQLLLRVALEEPRNQRFLLLSESGIPLYPAVAAHQVRFISSPKTCTVPYD